MKFQGIMFSKSFYHFLFSWQTPIKNYPHNPTYGGGLFYNNLSKNKSQLPNQIKTLLKA